MTVLSPIETTTSSADEHFLLELNRHITENMSNGTLDVNFLIDRMAIGRTTFYQKVKILTGMSVNDYINKIRIDRAPPHRHQRRASIRRHPLHPDGIPAITNTPRPQTKKGRTC